MYVVQLPDDVSLGVMKWLSTLEVGKLDLAYCNKSLRQAMLHMLKTCQFVQGLDISTTVNPKYINNYWSWIGIRKISAEYFSLRVFNLKNSELAFDLGTSSTLTLEIKDIRSYSITENTLIKVINNCPKLTSLCVSRVDSFSDTVFNGIEHTILEQLKELKITSCSANITDDAFVHLSKHCVRIQRLHVDVWECENIVLGLIQLIEVSSQLEYVNIRSNEECRMNKILSYISTYCVKIREVHLSGSSSLSLHEIKHLIAFRPTVTDILLNAYDKDGGLFQYLKKQTCKDKLNNNDTTINQLNIKTMIGKGYEKNVDCIMEFNEFLDSFKNCVKVGLYSEAITDLMLSTIAYNNPRMKEFIMQRCRNGYTVTGLKSIVTYCTDITEFQLVDCSHISGEDLVLLLNSQPNKITRLHICKHDTLTNNDIQNILVGNTQLKYVRFSDCLLVSTANVQEFLTENGLKAEFC